MFVNKTLDRQDIRGVYRDIHKERKEQRHTNGGVAQLGEHLPCKQGVMGSNPIISTKHFLKRKCEGEGSELHLIIWAYSSAG